MNDSNGEKISRENLLLYAEGLALKEFRPLLDGLFYSVAVIDPWEKEVCFSDQMTDLLGIAAGGFMYLSQFYQSIPDDERREMMSKYDACIGELMEHKDSIVSLTHKLIGFDSEIHTIRIDMMTGQVGKSKCIFAVIKDLTPDIKGRAYEELFGPGINSYIFIYDVNSDVCYVSYKFVEEFDLDSPVMKEFSSSYRRFIHPEDSEILHNAIYSFVENHSFHSSLQVRFLAPGRGEIYLRTDGFSDYGSEGRYVSGIFTDVTDYVNDNFLRQNMMEGVDAAFFTYDLNRNTTTITENIRKIIPDHPTVVEGDFVEELALRVIPQDRPRFRTVLNRSMQETGTVFAVEVRVRSGDDKSSWVAIRGKSFENRNTLTRILSGCILNLSRMNEVKDHYEKAGSSHELTGLPTRQRLLRDIQVVIRERTVTNAAVIIVDINDFHEFKDRYGMNTSDKILLNLASFLKAGLPNGAKLFHIGTDTFAVLWPGATQIKVNDYMKKLIEESASPLVTDHGKFYLALSASAAYYPEGRNAEELISQAEITLHKVKENKNLRYASFSPADRNDLREKLDFQMTITSDIRNGFENFMLYYQPLTDAKTGVLKGAEALLRWMKPTGEPENPEKVVAALELSDQMAAVGQWILDEAMRQCSEWISKGAPKDFYVHVNATADDLVTDDYVDRVVAGLKKHKLSPGNILIELTETSLLNNMASCRRNIELLHEHNIRTALDDFGSGYSSFNYLKELPVDEIKIDKTFVDDMLSNKFDNTFISAMTMLAHSIGKGVVVEGVENEAQYLMIRDMDADLIQGYYFGKPMSVFAFWNQYFG